MPITEVDTSLFPLLFAEKDFPEMSLQFRQKLQKHFALSWDTIKLLKQHLGKQSKQDLGRFFFSKSPCCSVFVFCRCMAWSPNLEPDEELLDYRALSVALSDLQDVYFRQFQSIRQVPFFVVFGLQNTFFLHFQIRCREKIALLQEMTKTSDFSRRSEAGN